MKKLIIFVLLILLTGCTVDYNLEVSNNSFKENIDIIINKTDNTTGDLENYVETDDQLTPFIEEPVNAFFSTYNENYKKKVKENDDFYKVSLSYNFSFNEFKKANSLNACFENIEIKEEDNKYFIHAYGNFYCLYEDIFNIKIKTKNKVFEHNANNVNNDLYVWNINYENQNNVDINIVIDKGIPLKKILINIGILSALIFGIGVCIYYLFTTNKKNNKI